MKRVPESFELTEADIQEAITYWINNVHDSYGRYEIVFKTQEVPVKPSEHAVIGGQGDWRKTVVTALAVKK